MLNSTPMAKIFDIIYPVGSIYMSTTLTTKAQVEAIFGGTWEKLEGRFLLGSSSSYANGATGGEASHTLTVDEMPSHEHIQRAEGANYQEFEVFRGWSDGETGSLIGNSHRANGTQAVYITNGSQYVHTWKAGNDQAHNNMPPYLVVNMFKRTALGLNIFLLAYLLCFQRNLLEVKQYVKQYKIARA